MDKDNFIEELAKVIAIREFVHRYNIKNMASAEVIDKQALQEAQDTYERLKNECDKQGVKLDDILTEYAEVYIF